MNKYLELKERHQQEVNALPLKFAFGQTQFDEMMKAFNVPTSEIRRVAWNTFALASDVPMIEQTFERHAQEKKDAMNDKEFAYSMFRYELCNHEYAYTYDVEDTLRALDLTKEEVDTTPLGVQLNRAIRDVLEAYD